MTTTAQQTPNALATERTDERHRGPRALIIALIALAVVTVALGAWQLIASNTTAPVNEVPAAAAERLAPYRPGGSVSQQQVPKAAPDELAPYRPGGSIYQQQVPKALADELAPFRSGGSVYQQQVPKAAD